jgi:hypothetical protein
MWESKWEDKPLGEVDSSFGLHRSLSSSSFKGLVSQELKEVEVSNCQRFETGGSLGRRVKMSPRAPTQMGRRETSAKGEERAAGAREGGGNPAAFVFVPRPGRVRLQ